MTRLTEIQTQYPLIVTTFTDAEQLFSLC